MQTAQTSTRRRSRWSATACTRIHPPPGHSSQRHRWLCSQESENGQSPIETHHTLPHWPRSSAGDVLRNGRRRSRSHGRRVDQPPSAVKARDRCDDLEQSILFGADRHSILTGRKYHRSRPQGRAQAENVEAQRPGANATGGRKNMTWLNRTTRLRRQGYDTSLPYKPGTSKEVHPLSAALVTGLGFVGSSFVISTTQPVTFCR